MEAEAVALRARGATDDMRALLRAFTEACVAEALKTADELAAGISS